jgi:hypothetical protein
MTEEKAVEPFETRFAGRVRAYTDPATERRIDALAISRTAILSGGATGWSQRGLGVGWLGRRIAGVRWGVAIVAVVFIGVVGVTVLGPLYNFGIGPQPSPAISPTPSPAPSATGAVPEVLRHSWQRPYAVTPGLDQWGSGFLSLASGVMDFGPETGAAASRSAIGAAGLDTLVATAIAETQKCAIGDIGAYRWSLEGNDTVMTLTAIRPDACAAREEALAGPWVRSDLPLPPDGVPMQPATYLTSAFDAFGKPGVAGQLSYRVPEGWKVKEDLPATFLLHHLPDASASQPSTDTFIFLLAQPRMAADFPPNATCGRMGEAPGVGPSVDDIVAAIKARPGVVSKPPAAVSIGGFAGQMLDLRLASSWTGGCQAPDGPIVGTQLLLGAGSETGPLVGLDAGNPLRLILLDLTNGRTMSIAIFGVEPSQSSQFEAQVAEAMPVIESFEFHPPVP